MTKHIFYNTEVVHVEEVEINGMSQQPLMYSFHLKLNMRQRINICRRERTQAAAYFMAPAHYSRAGRQEWIQEVEYDTKDRVTQTNA